MSKIAFALFVAAAAVSCVFADQEVLQALLEAYQPIVSDCSQSHGVSGDQIQGAIDSGNPEGIGSCFGGCLFKKTKVINSEGKYDPQVGLSQLKKYIKNEEHYKKIEKVANDCASVNEQEVSDGEGGCDRARLLMECVLQRKEELPL